MTEISVYVGNYGSGKTEIALNEAFISVNSGQNTTLVDLDIVNPYFRSSDRTASLEDAGIEVVSPRFAGMAVDLPSITAAVYGVFEREGRVIFDVGGDPSGAAALGRYHAHFGKAVSAQMFYVVNARRPLSTSADDIEMLLRRIEERSRLQVTGIINNTNLARDTRAEDVLYGQKEVRELSDRMGLPIAAIYATAEVMEALPQDFKQENRAVLRELIPRMRPEWLDVWV